MNEEWYALLDDQIIKMLIGDTIVLQDFAIDYPMPNMSYKEICEFSEKMGLKIICDDNPKKSRRELMKTILKYSIDKGVINDFFREICSLKRFKGLNSIIYSQPGELYWHIIPELFRQINNILYYDSLYMEYSIETWQFCLVSNKKSIKIDTTSINKIDFDYIKRLANEIDIVIQNGDYESSLTKCRTLLEEVMIFGLKKKNVTSNSRGDIKKLYGDFKAEFNMHQNNNIDKKINNLLSGFEKIITSISEMRNLNSDSHGAGDKRVKLKEYHVVLFKNASLTMAEFLLSVIENNMD